jgi:hypothetical protein
MKINPFAYTAWIGESIRITLLNEDPEEDDKIMTGVFVRMELVNDRQYFVIRYAEGSYLIPIAEIINIEKL